MAGFDDAAQVLDDLALEFIDITEAVRRLEILEKEPGQYDCGTCRFFHRVDGHAGECCQPGEPPRAEHALSVRCDNYQVRDDRGILTPGPDKSNGIMFK